MFEEMNDIVNKFFKAVDVMGKKLKEREKNEKKFML